MFGYDKITEVLTQNRGWVFINDLVDTDEVATLNVGSQQIEYQRPTKIIKEHFSGYLKLWNLKYSKWDFCLSNEQKVIIHNNETNDKLFRKSKDLLDFNRNSYELMTTVDSTKTTFKEDCCVFTDQELVLSGLIITDGNESDNQIRIYQSKIKNIEKIRNLLLDIGIEFSENIRQRNIIQICGKTLKKQPLPEHCFYLSANSSKKFLGIKKDWYKILKNISIRQTSFLLEGLILGDGNKRGNYECCTLFCGKQELANRFQIFFILRGMNASIYIPKDRTNDYRLNITNKNSWRFASSTKKALTDYYYNDFIYNIEIPNCTLLTRRNGKTLISGAYI